MLKYEYKQINPETEEVDTLASVMIDDKGFVSWFGDEAVVEQCKSELAELSSYFLGGKFDATNLEHWKLLPQVFAGGREWVQAVE